MLKMLSTVLFTLFVLGVTEANVCQNLSCQGDKCCQSIKNGEECCPADGRCDSQLGCMRNDNEISEPKQGLRKCPPGMKLCYSFIFFDVCCPHPMGVCCSDMAHCCPHGYECDVYNQRCNKKSSRLYKRDISHGKFGRHQCSGKVWCSKEDECCHNGDGEWSCCRNFTQPIAVGIEA